MTSADVVQKPWNYCNILRDEGMSCLTGWAHPVAQLI